MPVNSTHLDYDNNAGAWSRARDVFAGEDAIKSAGERYLPKLDCQSADEYNAYRARASFFNATARTADGFVGLIFRREPTFKVPDDRQVTTEQNGRSHLTPALSPARRGSGVGRALAAFVEDADMLGTTLSAYAKNVVTEVVAVGRAGTLVDWEDEAEQRAYAVLYTAEQILNWRTERVNGRNVLTLLALRENAEGRMKNDEGDAFEQESVEQIRVLKLAEVRSVRGEGNDGAQGTARPTQRRYVVEIWRQREGRNKRLKPEWVKVETRIPLRLGKALPLIPFVFHGPRHSLPAVDKLPLADIIAVNLDHYRLDADYKHGLHYTALPTVFVSGVEKTKEMVVGSRSAWVAADANAKATFLEFTGQGLTTFERAMDRDERLMAVLGTRMLEAQKRVGESADAIELRQSGENSVLSAVSFSVSDSLTHVLRWVYWWNSTEATPEAIGEDRVLVTVNSDFSTKGMASEEITAIVSAWQAGAISRESMFELFRRGEVLPPGRTNEDEARLAGAGTFNAQHSTSNAQRGNGSDGTKDAKGKT
jgi:hypothetical protein